jgi:hypothetical protein
MTLWWLSIDVRIADLDASAVSASLHHPGSDVLRRRDVQVERAGSLQAEPRITTIQPARMNAVAEVNDRNPAGEPTKVRKRAIREDGVRDENRVGSSRLDCVPEKSRVFARLE